MFNSKCFGEDWSSLCYAAANESNVGGKVNTGIEIQYVATMEKYFETQTYVPPLSTRVLQGRPADTNTASNPLHPRWPSCPSQKDVPVKGLGADACFLPFMAADDSKVGGDVNTGKVLRYKI